ncbi:hypothetical protein DJ568_02780 [Mucilaginibacter hurinus]|uniref:Uncharacterized protein n=1 Tax=Mucilaginibacter hurinus TaxID=2201324 RepID=A0A367GUC1_9SPHI|nr:hypothetical protein [Mucilaginibacter hurinus]RCH56798.1 hypothetical protein DJ568_02780 [Mucilaginibacter hurinus]
MSRQSEYQSPLVDPEKKMFRAIWKEFCGNLEILKHALVPHQHAKLPPKKFEASHFQDDQSYTYEVAMEMYRESTKRIDALEEKGFKLLTYISAVSAILIYFLSTEIAGWFKLFVILSLFCLTLAIIISLRCISIKHQKVLFIDAMFNFEADTEPVPKSRNTVTAEILTCTVYNQTVADNTADILKGARVMLGYGIFFTIISCVFFLAVPVIKKEENKVQQMHVTMGDSSLRDKILSSSARKDTQLVKMRTELDRLNRKLDSIVRAGKVPLPRKPDSVFKK